MTQESDAPVRIAVIESSNLYRAALTCLLSHHQGLTVAIGCQNTHALSEYPRSAIDVVLLWAESVDHALRDLLARIHEAQESARVILLTRFIDEELFVRALDMGARGVVLTHQSPELLVKAIGHVHKGEIWVGRHTTNQIVATLVRRRSTGSDKLTRLTAREREVIISVARGLTNRASARLLCISEATIRNHLTSVFGKLKLSNRTELMVYAYRHGLAEVSTGKSGPGT